MVYHQPIVILTKSFIPLKLSTEIIASELFKQYFSCLSTLFYLQK